MKKSGSNWNVMRRAFNSLWKDEPNRRLLSQRLNIEEEPMSKKNASKKNYVYIFPFYPEDNDIMQHKLVKEQPGLINRKWPISTIKLNMKKVVLAKGPVILNFLYVVRTLTNNKKLDFQFSKCCARGCVPKKNMKISDSFLNISMKEGSDRHSHSIYF